MKPQRVGSTSAWQSPLVDVGIWLVAFGTTGAILWFSLGPTGPSHGVDKIMHAVAYFVNTLAILFALVWRPGRDKRGFDAAVWIAVLILLAGGLIEVVQGRFAHRDAQFLDWMADALGIVLALLVFALARRTLSDVGNETLTG